MPTSAAGSSARCRRNSGRRPGTTGFTLLELLVVIAIIALATAGVGLSLRDSGQAALDREAERLVALLESARAQSRASGVAVRWRVTPDGPGNFSFDGLPLGALPTAWLSGGITAQPIGVDGRAAAALQLGPDPIIAAQQVLLTSQALPDRSLRVGTDGLRPFAVVAP
ncbi:prepilin-type N-terminal cleavage/methylation domain-containing protein [Variovorax saccharolyticus]|uniref:prepilin-type N-terminal cleavage/methylation domain-containing protein n=1 Tax=Variovorax saccharolyticus TaxID=3053516 RepID=UPI002574F2A8|nr:prepilin-type N-terminal cleavage/methylation domain-containing protein [Variovorax sp. J31P216]MDM0024851.1 prepilin-type N-terminal cleavage/methylation domain-containing protein [Variovorax sp. J31P216]